MVEEAQPNQVNSTTSQPNDSTYVNYEDDDDDYPETFAENNQMTADADSSGYTSGRVYPIKCHALYDFQVHAKSALQRNI